MAHDLPANGQAEKSYRDMDALERRYYSLSSRVFRAVMRGACLIMAVSVIISVVMYARAQTSRYVADAYHLAQNTVTVLEQVTDVEPYATTIMTAYRRMSPERRSQSQENAYVWMEAEENYQKILEVLRDIREDNPDYDIYLAMYDRETQAVVYIADLDDGPGTITCLPGEWETVTEREIETFRSPQEEAPAFFGHSQRFGWLCTSGAPILDDKGNILCLVMVDVSIGSVAQVVSRYLLQYSVVLLATVLLVAYMLTRRMRRDFIEPINRIADAAVRYVDDKRSGEANRTHFEGLSLRTGDELENLSLIMADMERDLNEYEDNLTKVTQEKERIGTELALATRIQADMLPNTFPAFPERPDFDIFASMTPAKEVGGDFYDFFLIDDDHLGLVMADVSGKGVPAALFMMASRILIQNFAMTGRSPKEVLETVNNQICANNREEMFVTVWFGILELSSGKLTAANAGHEYPVLKKPDGDFELVKDKHGFVIGGMAGMRYREYTLQMDPGAKLFHYTDGVAEAMNAQNELFGTGRMLEALTRNSQGSPKSILNTVGDAVDAFVLDAPQFDDLTMLCVHYIGKDGGHMKELTIDATVENIASVTEFVNTELEALNCPTKARIQIDVAIDELFGNIAHYAYAPETGPATVRVEVEEDPLSVIITFIDNGKPYDPLASVDPDTTLSAEERQIGGLGVFLVKKTMDDVSYAYKNGQNILQVRKKM